MVLVTGGAQGLGADIVTRFSKNGYDVIIGYLNNEEKALILKNKLNSLYKTKCVCEKINITDENNVKKLFTKYNIDIVINNAALVKDNFIEEKTYEEFCEVVNTNLCGTYLVCKYAKCANYIINISSKDGIDTYNPISLDYSASKAGIINLSKNLSLYYEKTKIYCVCPSWIDTSSVRLMNQDYLKKELKRTNQKNLLKPEEVANKIFSLINSNIESGSVIIIDE